MKRKRWNRESQLWEIYKGVSYVMGIPEGE
jgi:hypothetical protein